MADTLIVPGLNGSPDGHWQRYWADADQEAELVEQDDFATPRLADWLHVLEERIAASAPGVVLVAHSLGCNVVAALAGRPAALHIGGALLVAPAEIDALSDTHPTAIEFAAARSVALPFASILVASRNDPFMSFRAAERQAERWRSALFDLGAAGHINIASGYGRWNEAHVLADGLRGRTRRHVPVPRDVPRLWDDVNPRLAAAHDGGLGIG